MSYRILIVLASILMVGAATASDTGLVKLGSPLDAPYQPKALEDVVHREPITIEELRIGQANIAQPDLSIPHPRIAPGKRPVIGKARPINSHRPSTKGRKLVVKRPKGL